MDELRGRVFNVGGGVDNTLSVIEMVNWLDRKGGDDLKLVYKDWRVADHKVYISDITKVSKEVSWQPRIPVIDGLEKTWEWVNSRQGKE